jgi:DNA-binding XRE family transcriptional regulator
MSTLSEKMRLIREVESKSREEFGKEIGVPKRTIEGIENEGRVPRGDVVEKVAARWPRYAFWLITGNTDLPFHISPDRSTGTVLRVFENVSNLHPGSDDLMTRPEWFGKVQFIQRSDEKNDLYALIETIQPELMGIKQCIFIGSGMNLCSDGSGKNRLNDLASYLIQKGRADLIKTSELKICLPGDINTLFETKQIEESALQVPDLGKAEWLKKLYTNFTAWKMEGESYEPKFTWQDLK